MRLLELRLLAGTLAIGWAIAGGVVLLAYRPGGPIDLLVGVAAGLPTIVAVAAVVWPPLANDDRAFGAIVWLGVGSLILLLPSIGGIMTQLLARGPQTLLPSPEAGYSWFLALLATSLFAGFGLARRHLGAGALRRHRFVRGTILGLAATLLVGGTFTGVAIANDLALKDRPVAASRFGPTDPSVEPPACTDPIAIGAYARVDLSLAGDVDGRSIGTVDVRGVRAGGDFRWLAYVATSRLLGQYGAARVGSGAWLLEPGRNWTAATPGGVASFALDADLLATALTTPLRATAELHGISVFEGARASHCRIAIDGSTFKAAFPESHWIVGNDADLEHWRGELDFWVFTDGELGRVSGSVNGPAVPIAGHGLQATLRVTMTATDRATPVEVSAPAS